MEKEEIEKLLNWKRLYNEYDFEYLTLMDRYAIHWFIVKLCKELKIECLESNSYQIIEEEIMRKKSLEGGGFY